MIEVSDLERMAEKLRVYDVVQDGWEHDPDGSNPLSVEANLKHVGEHLAGVLAVKDFSDEQVVREEIVPDFMQYGLRVARWGGLALDGLIRGGNKYIPEARRINGRLNIQHVGTLPVTSLIYANGILLGVQMHDEDHDGKHAEAVALRSSRVKDVSSILIRTALYEEAWRSGEIDIEQAFDDRLATLRERSNIPQPESEL